ncbi:Pectinesterase [Melia azedarach]|uniref:Pectinesterase n=1 Tax=Melia azedarach TaxID=155640 RepID=A0ACC1XC58_MELAZ|nr:Pectinesterase [Melia azedarach]
MGKPDFMFMLFWLLGLWPYVEGSYYYQRQIPNKCSFTRFPGLCVQTLVGFQSTKMERVHVVSALINKTISETKIPTSYFSQVHSQLVTVDTQESQRVRAVTDHCEEMMGMSLKRLEQSLLALRVSPTKNKQDIQTWLSAAVTFQETCKDSVKSLSLSSVSSTEILDKIYQKMEYLSQLCSNPLALVNRITSINPKNTTNNRFLNQDQVDFPNWVSTKTRKLLQAKGINANAVVAKDGTGNYKTVSEAINAASGNRFVIYVKAGVYKEKIRTNKDGITLIGDGKYSTIITGDDSVAGGSSMPASATFTITGDGFIARDIGFHNTAGPGGQQALALNAASDRSVFYRCSIAGYQDTLYALALRQFYRDTDIYGTVDFIFGNAAAVFQNCYIVLRRPKGGYNAVLANGRSDPGQNTGFSLQNCRIAVGSDFAPVKHSYNSYLGRPWKQYSRSVVMQSTIDDSISSRGWIEWPGEGSYSKTLYFAEYSNVGPGAATSGRVNWPGFHVIGADEAVKFTVGKFIAGTTWLPSTGVTFISGLQ